MVSSFEQALEDLKSREGWEFADREALWKLMFEAGYQAGREDSRCEQQKEVLATAIEGRE